MLWFSLNFLLHMKQSENTKFMWQNTIWNGLLKITYFQSFRMPNENKTQQRFIFNKFEMMRLLLFLTNTQTLINFCAHFILTPKNVVFSWTVCKKRRDSLHRIPLSSARFSLYYFFIFILQLNASMDAMQCCWTMSSQWKYFL